MVARMIDRGHTMTVWNRTEAKARRLEPLGVRVVATPDEAVASAERVHMTLPEDDVVDDLVARVAPALLPGAVIVDHSTTLPARTKDRQPRLAAKGIRFLHAPVFMSPEMASQGGGMMLVAGATADYEAVKEALAQMTGHVSYWESDLTLPPRTSCSVTRCCSCSQGVSRTYSRLRKAPGSRRKMP